jgi:6-pyruvoyltetrahydropterin/6-carboxytetrahydropterin synthase
MDFGEIKRHLSEIISSLDHTFLNDLAFLQDGNPSSENIARYIAIAMQEKISDPSVRISRVTTWESEDASATYIP